MCFRCLEICYYKLPLKERETGNALRFALLQQCPEKTGIQPTRLKLLYRTITVALDIAMGKAVLDVFSWPEHLISSHSHLCKIPKRSVWLQESHIQAEGVMRSRYDLNSGLHITEFSSIFQNSCLKRNNYIMQSIHVAKQQNPSLRG